MNSGELFQDQLVPIRWNKFKISCLCIRWTRSTCTAVQMAKKNLIFSRPWTQYEVWYTCFSEKKIHSYSLSRLGRWLMRSKARHGVCDVELTHLVWICMHVCVSAFVCVHECARASIFSFLRIRAWPARRAQICSHGTDSLEAERPHSGTPVWRLGALSSFRF